MTKEWKDSLPSICGICLQVCPALWSHQDGGGEMAKKWCRHCHSCQFKEKKEKNLFLLKTKAKFQGVLAEMMSKQEIKYSKVQFKHNK